MVAAVNCLSHFFPCHRKPVYSDKKPSIRTGPLYSWKFGGKERENYDLSKDYPSAKCDLVCNPSSRWFPWRVSASAASFFSDQTNSENASPLVKHSSHGVEFNRVNCLVWVLHESARSFSLAVESLKLPGSGAELSNAWLGKDVHEWHKVAGYQVAVYALLKTAIGVEFLLSRERSNGPLPVQEILGKRLNFLENYIEIQLRERHAELVNWFRRVELPRIEAYFAPLLKKWSMEFAGSGVAGIIVAITCCAAVSKLGPRQSSCASVSLTIDDILVELMELSHRLVSVDKLYNLAAEAGCELLFLTYFGTKILPSKNVEELEFWIGLAKQKLLVAFHEEPVISGLKVFQDEVKADSLAVLGLFAYLGRSTRLYLSKMGIKDIDDLVKDFLSYLECGILFIHPEFSSMPVYQLFMDVIKDEIGWLDFYASLSFVRNPERKRSKQHPIQAEKEMILSAVFTVCYDVFSGFAHLSRSTLQPLDAELLAFLLRSQNLLALCLEDYWAAYDRSCTYGKGSSTEAKKTQPVAETQVFEPQTDDDTSVLLIVAGLPVGSMDGYPVALNRHYGVHGTSPETVARPQGLKAGAEEAKEDIKRYSFTYPRDNSDAASCNGCGSCGHLHCDQEVLAIHGKAIDSSESPSNVFSVNHVSISIGYKIDPFSIFLGTLGHGETTKED
ncbi:hypothetical protein CRG98_040046 [Punica granatum]|uniref:4Fe-4S ferredoxin-type domain-containing protein n=1 Tax=Punica granatum TaxID=22663 RepID=A0A2I0I845_PUNGR|nr:hypothetical protein CRG98_040046 [Punica granatum]